MPTPVRYVALLAAVNVGRRQMKMERLREVIRAVGFDGVGTYIQTGNLFFTAPASTTADSVQRQIEQAISTEFGFGVETVLHTVADFARIVEGGPFSADPLTPDERQLIVFLRRPPAALPPLPAPSSNGSFSIIGADAPTDPRALYVQISDARTWARTSPAEMKRLLGPMTTTGRWRHTSERILAAAQGA